MIKGMDTNSRVWTHRHIIIWPNKRKHSSPHSILFRFLKTFFHELNLEKVWKSTKQLIRYRGIFSTGSFFKSIGPQTHLFEKNQIWYALGKHMYPISMAGSALKARGGRPPHFFGHFLRNFRRFILKMVVYLHNLEPTFWNLDYRMMRD